MQGSSEILGIPSLFLSRKLKSQQACLAVAGAKDEIQLLSEMLTKAAREKKHSRFSLFLFSGGPLVPALADSGVWETQPVGLRGEQGKRNGCV